jgi:tetratricopeptide (TPR) repeat protein
MKPKLYLFIISLLTIFAFSCRTAKKMYEKGNYDEAVELAAKKLQKDPGDPKLISLITEAYRYAESDHQANIRSLSQSDNELKWEWIYNEYVSLQKMYDAIYRVPAILNLLRPADQTSSLIAYAEKAGDVRMERGLYFMEQGDKISYRKAYREFKAALGFKPGHRDISLKMEEAYELAVTNVIVHPIHQFGGYVHSGYTPGGMNFDDQVIRDLQFNGGNEFTRFYSAWDARSQRIRADLELELDLTRLEQGRPQVTRNQRRSSKQVVVKETVYRPDSIVREYAWVHADIHTTRTTEFFEARLDVSLRGAGAGWLWSDHVSAARSWTNESVYFTGDQRALTDQDRELLNRNSSVPPHEHQITRELLDEINRNAISRIRNYFNSRDL